MKNLFSLLFCLATSLVFSQAKKPVKVPDIFEPAYIVTLKGDTVKGLLKMPKLSRFETYEKIYFKDVKTNKVRQYLPHKITGYGYNNYFYTSAYHDNKPCFFKVLSKGTLTLYAFYTEVFDEGKPIEVHDYSVSREGAKQEEFFVLEAKGLKKQLKDLFKANKELAKKIHDQKEIPFNDETFEAYFNEFNGITNNQ